MTIRKQSLLMPEAETLYVRRGRTMEQIADELSVARSTVGRWAAVGNWKRKRVDWLRNSPQAPLDKLRERRLQLIQGMATDPDKDPTVEDRLSKITKIIEQMEARTEAVGPLLESMHRFVQWALTNLGEEAMNAIRDAVDGFLGDVRRDRA